MPFTTPILSVLILSLSCIHQTLSQDYPGAWQSEQEPQFSPDGDELLPSPYTEIISSEPELAQWSPQPEYHPEPSASPSTTVSSTAHNPNSSSLLGRKYITTYELLTFKSEKPVLWSNGNKFKYTAVYAFRSGQLFGLLDVKTRRMSGNWTQSVAERVCQNPGSGSSMFWGTFYFDFTWDWNSFHGKWGFCNDQPTKFWSGDEMASLGLT